MLTVGDIIRQLLRRGSRPRCPDWPPDAFAVAATLVERGGCYVEPRFTAAWDERYAFGETYSRRVARAAKVWHKRWRPDGTAPRAVQNLWRKLLDAEAMQLAAACNADNDWMAAAVELMAVADAASTGLGFVAPPKYRTPLLDHLIEAHAVLLDRALEDTDAPLPLPYVPHSVCKQISPDLACVQPKSRTPQVGCTLRSLSHNLALLPPRGVVTTVWNLGVSAEQESETAAPLNVLLVPFPYVVHGRNFRPVLNGHYNNDHYFAVVPEWIPWQEPDTAADGLVELLARLVDVAARDTGPVNAVILPEASLTREIAVSVADRLAARVDSLQLFVSGTVHFPENGLPVNAAYTRTFRNGTGLKDWFQTKHHRWCLERTQITRYHLGHALRPHLRWWEQIDVDERTCNFTVIRPGASLAVLICEDLARFDPVLPAINAIGPNLLVALLMDGPQLPSRWPARYATVLAEDPGCSVLTLTCLGMVQRSAMPGSRSSRQIALWKQAGGPAVELEIAPGDHALALTLTSSFQEQLTLDMRPDGATTVQFELTAVRGVRARTEGLPAWLELE